MTYKLQDAAGRLYPLGDTPRRSERLVLWVSADQLVAIKAAAERAGLPPVHWAREVIEDTLAIAEEA